jgi:hypothetical protein
MSKNYDQAQQIPVIICLSTAWSWQDAETGSNCSTFSHPLPIQTHESPALGLAITTSMADRNTLGFDTKIGHSRFVSVGWLPRPLPRRPSHQTTNRVIRVSPQRQASHPSRSDSGKQMAPWGQHALLFHVLGTPPSPAEMRYVAIRLRQLSVSQCDAIKLAFCVRPEISNPTNTVLDSRQPFR